MGRKRQYGSAAERLAAWRERQKKAGEENVEVVASAPASAPGIKAKRKVSKPARLRTIEAEAQALMDELQSWRDNLPESLQDGSVADKLDAAIEGCQLLVDTAAEIDLPKGYGRD